MKTRRLLLLISLLLMMTGPVWGIASHYSVSYVKEHQLYDDGEGLNVMDIDLEWPEMIDGIDVAPLRQFLSEKLFGMRSAAFDSVYTAFKSSLGTPVEKQFSSLPDDRKICYVEISLRLLGRKTDNFVSFEFSKTYRPGRLSKKKPVSVMQFITYDLQGQRVLVRGDILRSDKMGKETKSRSLLLPVFDGAEYDVLMIRDAALVDGLIVLLHEDRAPDGTVMMENIVMTLDELGSYASKDTKALLKKKQTNKLKTDETGEQTNRRKEWNDIQPEEPAVFFTPDMTLSDYLKSNLRKVDASLDGKQHGTVEVVFTIDMDGIVCRPCVVKTLSPAYDREAVRVVRSIPRWQPARSGGAAVDSRMSVEIEF